MDPVTLEKMVEKKYWELNVEDGRLSEESLGYMAPELLRLRSNQMRALIAIVAFLLPDGPPETVADSND